MTRAMVNNAIVALDELKGGKSGPENQILNLVVDRIVVQDG